MKKILFTLIMFFCFKTSICALSIPSNNAILMDSDTGRVLYSKNIDEKHLIADEGKVLKNIQSNVITGSDVYMDKICINGVYLDDFAENYEEINEIKPMIE